VVRKGSIIAQLRRGPQHGPALQLGWVDTAFARAWEEGRAKTLEQAFEYAL